MPTGSPFLAYIDPGTGSALVYVVIGLLVSAYFALRETGRRVVDLALSGRHERRRYTLVVHSEHPRYESTFMPILRALSARSIEVKFFTMYARDESFEPLPPGVEQEDLAEGMLGYARLNNLSASVLLTTTPQLDVMTFRRSRRVGHYAIINHALGESRYVKPFAYDFFDTVLCCGPVLEQNIRRMEAIRGFKAKRLLHTGLPHYDDFSADTRRAEKVPRENERPTVLVAPSWGALSIFQRFGPEFLAPLSERFHLIVRPHPQMRYSQVDLYHRLVALDGVEVDTSRTPMGAMSRADVLVSDFSGIIHEFAFLYLKPVVVIEPPTDFGGLEGALLGGQSEIAAACSSFIRSVPSEEFDALSDRVAEALASISPGAIAAIREQLVYNFGHSAAVAAEQLHDIIRSTP